MRTHPLPKILLRNLLLVSMCCIGGCCVRNIDLTPANAEQPTTPNPQESHQNTHPDNEADKSSTALGVAETPGGPDNLASNLTPDSEKQPTTHNPQASDQKTNLDQEVNTPSTASDVAETPGGPDNLASNLTPDSEEQPTTHNPQTSNQKTNPDQEVDTPSTAPDVAETPGGPDNLASNLTLDSEGQPTTHNPPASYQNTHPDKTAQENIFTLINELPSEILDKTREYLATGSDKSTMPPFQEAMGQLQAGSMDNNHLLILVRAIATKAQEYIGGLERNGHFYKIQDKVNRAIEKIKELVGVD